MTSPSGTTNTTTTSASGGVVVNSSSRTRSGSNNSCSSSDVEDGDRHRGVVYYRWLIHALALPCDYPLRSKRPFLHDALQDGSLLTQLAHVLFKVPMPTKVVTSGGSEMVGASDSMVSFHALDSAAAAFGMLATAGVTLPGVLPSKLLEKDPKIGIDILWGVICHTFMTNTGNSSGSLHSKRKNEKEALLAWVNSKLPVKVHDFDKSWRDGLNFASLANSICPDTIDCNSISAISDLMARLDSLFKEIELKLQIPALLDPSHVLSHPVDKHLIMTYVSEFIRCDPSSFKSRAPPTVSNTSKCGSTVTKTEEATRPLDSLPVENSLIVRTDESSKPNEAEIVLLEPSSESELEPIEECEPTNPENPATKSEISAEIHSETTKPTDEETEVKKGESVPTISKGNTVEERTTASSAEILNDLCVKEEKEYHAKRVRVSEECAKEICEEKECAKEVCLRVEKVSTENEESAEDSTKQDEVQVVDELVTPKTPEGKESVQVQGDPTLDKKEVSHTEAEGKVPITSDPKIEVSESSIILNGDATAHIEERQQQSLEPIAQVDEANEGSQKLKARGDTQEGEMDLPSSQNEGSLNSLDEATIVQESKNLNDTMPPKIEEGNPKLSKEPGEFPAPLTEVQRTLELSTEVKEGEKPTEKEGEHLVESAPSERISNEIYPPEKTDRKWQQSDNLQALLEIQEAKINRLEREIEDVKIWQAKAQLPTIPDTTQNMDIFSALQALVKRMECQENAFTKEKEFINHKMELQNEKIKQLEEMVAELRLQIPKIVLPDQVIPACQGYVQETETRDQTNLSTEKIEREPSPSQAPATEIPHAGENLQPYRNCGIKPDPVEALMSLYTSLLSCNLDAAPSPPIRAEIDDNLTANTKSPEDLLHTGSTAELKEVPDSPLSKDTHPFCECFLPPDWVPDDEAPDPNPPPVIRVSQKPEEVARKFTVESAVANLTPQELETEICTAVFVRGEEITCPPVESHTTTTLPVPETIPDKSDLIATTNNSVSNKTASDTPEPSLMQPNVIPGPSPPESSPAPNTTPTPECSSTNTPSSIETSSSTGSTDDSSTVSTVPSPNASATISYSTTTSSAATTTATTCTTTTSPISPDSESSTTPKDTTTDSTKTGSTGTTTEELPAQPNEPQKPPATDTPTATNTTGTSPSQSQSLSDTDSSESAGPRTQTTTTTASATTTTTTGSSTQPINIEHPSEHQPPFPSASASASASSSAAKQPETPPSSPSSSAMYAGLGYKWVKGTYPTAFRPSYSASSSL
ncbi:hypothetical protein Pelo_9859 [Pelomyxa schiedti]|nr:hypothetical protein Pelo_9859 [Pelomyxa schiedti]